MTDSDTKVEQTDTKTEQPEQKPAQESKAPPQPTIDPKEIAKQVSASINIQDEIKKSLRETFAGQPEKKSNPLHEEFLKDPASLLKDVKDLAKKEIREEDDQKRAIEERRQVELGPIAKEYADKHPALKSTAAGKMVDAELARLARANPDLSEKEALTQALDSTVKELEALGVKSPTEEERKKAEQAALTPPMSYAGIQIPGGNSKPASDSDFLQAQREFREQFKKPQANK